MAILTVV